MKRIYLMTTFLLAVATLASATFYEVELKPTKVIYRGSQNDVLIYLENDTYVFCSNPNMLKSVLSVALTAKTTGTKLFIRYEGVNDCTTDPKTCRDIYDIGIIE